ncbi:MAG: phospholipase D family protein [Candidatus Diapherotrites archaeon]|jgi:phosphatidylserine/phosphatidylglycerophosphate/cardiolipin synthase-like enzyme|uniref:Phospholipase D family protein n=1 Tax=Candidatus Iainarchaeum sp. TaxID=3101447 RepID=A0A7K4C0B7_9ARCH|nr:phospholipase D family protein [Candidatus Diapherotrites archaeon]
MKGFEDLKKGKGFSKNSVFSSSGIIFFVVVLILAIFVLSYLRDQPVAFEESISGNKTIVANTIEPYFCPEDECSKKVIGQINSANKSIYVAIYSFSMNEIADALILAHNRGVEVKVIFDYSQSKMDYSVDEKLSDAGIEIKRSDGSGLMHNKFCIIDENVVMGGSFNYSVNADEKNDENLLVIYSEELAAKFLNEFNEIWEQSTR